MQCAGKEGTVALFSSRKRGNAKSSARQAADTYKSEGQEEKDMFDFADDEDAEEGTTNDEAVSALAEPDESITLADDGEESGEDGEDTAYAAGRNKFMIPDSDFGPLLPYVSNPEITDVDYNGQDLWVTDVYNRKVKAKETLTQMFVERFVRSVANAKSFDFNQKNPVMEAETKELRISVVHKSVAVSGTSICIRKTPPFKRISEHSAIETGYADREVISFLANCIRAHMNIVVAGQPRAGKTELAKFLGCYIPDSERVITIEDVMEWRFKQLKPQADCIEIQTNSTFDYTDAIIASLKQNPNWIMIAETRGREVASLINSFSTGVNGITTLHTDSVDKIPQRMLNMIDEANVEQRMLGNIYEFVDVGVMVSIRKNPQTGERRRIVDQVGIFTYSGGETGCHLVVDGGRIVSRTFPEVILHKFSLGGVKNNFFTNSETDRRLKKQGYSLESDKPDGPEPERDEKKEAAGVMQEDGIPEKKKESGGKTAEEKNAGENPQTDTAEIKAAEEKKTKEPAGDLQDIPEDAMQEEAVPVKKPARKRRTAAKTVPVTD